MSLTSTDINLCAEWMRLQAVNPSLPDEARAYFAMAAEWFADWSATQRFQDEPAIALFIDQCLQTCGDDYRALQHGSPPPAGNRLH